MAFGLTDRMLNLLEGLALAQPVQDFLGARLDPKGQKIAVGLFHQRQLIHRHRVNPAFTAPVELQPAVNDAAANLADTLAVQEKMIVGEVNRAVAHIAELLHFAQDVGRRPVAPFALRQGGDIAVDAGIGAAAGGLDGAEFVQGEHRRDIQGQRLDVVDGEAGPVGVRELIQVPDERPGGVVDHLAGMPPNQGEDGAGIIQVAHVVRQQLFALPHPHAVEVGAVLEDAVRIHGGKRAADDEGNFRRRQLKLPGQTLKGRVGGRRQAGEGDDVRGLCLGRLGDMRPLHPGVAGVEQPHPVSLLAQDRRQGLDP